MPNLIAQLFSHLYELPPSPLRLLFIFYLYTPTLARAPVRPFPNSCPSLLHASLRMDQAFVGAAEAASSTSSAPGEKSLGEIKKDTASNDKHRNGKSPQMAAVPATNGAPSAPLSAVEAWGKFDLTSRREKLDTQALDIATRQDTSSASRKKLADKTYRALYDIPDPITELKNAETHRKTNAELQENSALNSELTSTVKKYEAKIIHLEKNLADNQANLAHNIKAAIDKKQAEWMNTQTKAMEAYELREQELLHQLSLGNENTRALKTISDRNQQALNNVKSELEELKKNKIQENENIMEDLEKNRAENSQLRRRIAELEDHAGNTNEQGINKSALSAELAARDVEVSQLKDQVHVLESVLGGKDAEKSHEFTKLTESIRLKDEEISTMKSSLDKLPSFEEYEVLKRQFETLRTFQLQDGGDNEEDGNEDAGNEGDVLEKRLLAKMKVLEGKLTRLRMELVEREGKIASLNKSNCMLEEQVSDQKQLISKLEDGINVITTADPRSPRKGNEGTISESGDDGSNWEWGTESREAAGLQRIMVNSNAGSVTAGAAEDPSMLDIISGQRDRFRERTMELETENRKLMERVERLSADMDALKSDNVRLYGKIRFLQNYKGSGSGLIAAEAGLAGPEDTDNVSMLGKYSKMYECPHPKDSRSELDRGL